MRRRAASIVALSLIAVACGGQTAASSPSPAPSGGVQIPTDQLPPDIQCLVDQGFALVGVDEPQFEGDSRGYRLTSDLPRAQARSIEEECQKLAPPDVPKTEAELRVVYDRWIAERECLIGLGYTPASPPSFEKFVSDWRSPTGPWTPIDGVDTQSWSSREYEEAKKRCTLEMYDRN